MIADLPRSFANNLLRLLFLLLRSLTSLLLRPLLLGQLLLLTFLLLAFLFGRLLASFGLQRMQRRDDSIRCSFIQEMGTNIVPETHLRGPLLLLGSLLLGQLELALLGLLAFLLRQLFAFFRQLRFLGSGVGGGLAFLLRQLLAFLRELRFLGRRVGSGLLALFGLRRVRRK